MTTCALALVLLAGCTSGPPIRHVLPPPPTKAFPSGPAPPTQPAKCSGHVPHLPAQMPTVPGAASQMVPGSPTVAVLCSGTTRVVITGPQLLKLVADLNALHHEPLPGNGPRSCLTDLGPTYVLWFDYAPSGRQVVTVEAAGCAFTRNAQLVARPDQAVLGRIDFFFSKKAA